MKEILAEIRPTPEQQTHMDRLVQRLTTAAQSALGDRGQATVQGSIAKGTWIAGNKDIDLFLLLDLDTPEEDLASIAKEVANATLQDVKQRYAQHPYQVGTFEDHTIDLVPAYHVEDASEHRSAVDRTPFHTAWVAEHLDERARDEVRLAKQWMKGIGTYGAETAIGGFSGYLVEVLVQRFGSFDGILEWLAAGAKPRQWDDLELPEHDGPLQIGDPTDPQRNVAAAVKDDVLETAIEAALAFQARPGRQFFFPRPTMAADLPRPAPGTWAALLLTPATERLDLVLPQFHRAGRIMADDLSRAGFTDVRTHAFSDDLVLLQWHATAVPGATRDQHGPPADKAANAQRFREKWEGHRDAAGPIQERDGRLFVAVINRNRTIKDHIQATMDRILTAKHVRAALPHALLTDEVEALPEQYHGVAADFILGRRPWQR